MSDENDPKGPDNSNKPDSEHEKPKGPPDNPGDGHGRPHTPPRPPKRPVG